MLVKIICDLHILALSCVNQICVNIFFGDFAGEEEVTIGEYGR